MIVGLVRLYQVKKQFWHSLKQCESCNDNWSWMIFGAWNLCWVHQDEWEGWGWWGTQRGNPRIQKTQCFIPEFLLGKETVHVNWKSGAEDGVQVRRGVRPVDSSHHRNSSSLEGSDFELRSQMPHRFPNPVPVYWPHENHLLAFTPFSQLLHLENESGSPSSKQHDRWASEVSTSLGFQLPCNLFGKR